jgi:hypothetical protein
MIRKYSQFISESIDISGGKNLFKCYLKVFTALNLKDTKPDFEKTPEIFLIYFRSNPVSIDILKSIMNRYQQFNTFISGINYEHNDCQLYFGIKCDSTFEYGISSEDQVIPIGKFKLSKGILNWLVTLDSPSAINLKREIVHLDINKISLFCKIKNEMKNFLPGQSEKKTSPKINGEIISFGYYGIGKWENGKIDMNNLNDIKSKIKIFLSKYKWADRIQVSVTSNQFWIYLNIKIK